MKNKSVSHESNKHTYKNSTTKQISNFSDKPVKIFIVIFLSFFFQLCVSPEIEAQEGISPLNDKFKTEWIAPDLIEKFSAPNKNSNNPEIGNPKKARFIYLIPSNKTYREEYKAAITDAVLHLQDFYQKEMGNGTTFSLNDPIVEVYQTSNPSSWYSTNPRGGFAGYFVNNTLADGFALTGGYLGDPNNRWLFYIDADPACGQGVGANGNPISGGWAILPANDLRGLNGEANINPCGGNPDTAGKYRWIGGLGHELGHTWDLPHPPGCDPPTNNCSGGTFAAYSLMWFGYAFYPNTYLLPADRQTLSNTGYFSTLDLRSPQFSDFNNDRKADFAVWRPANGLWSILPSSGGNPIYSYWGQNGDKVVPGDYDGDDVTDLSVWRPGSGIWYILQSSNSVLYAEQFGAGADIPIAADYDGDRLTDIAVWRPSNGVWYINRSASNTVLSFQFGANEDKPIPADYNGDKRTDIAVFRPSVNTWYLYNNYLSYYYANPQVNTTAVIFGNSNDKLLPADYDGDKKADIAVWRPSDGVWYYIGSSSGISQRLWGQNGDIPVPADYDNDGKVDFSVWRPNNGTFYVLRSSDNILQAAQWGASSDFPVASAFVR